MGTRTQTDLGPTVTRIEIRRDGASNTSCVVAIRTTDGERMVMLDGAAIAAALTGAEITALKATAVKLYNAAAAADGFA